MKTVGLIGGMSWESSLEYYRLINRAVSARLGGLHSARCVMYSVDFADIEVLQHQDRWADAAAILIDAAQRVERAGADFLVLCTNTMHKLAADIESATRLPLLHIADATAERVLAAGIRRVGLLATRFTMEEDFYTGRMRERHGLDVIVPDERDRELVHRVIYEELCRGVIDGRSRMRFFEIMNRLRRAGAEGILLGCTEIPLLVMAPDGLGPAALGGSFDVPLFDSTRIHVEAAVTLALA